VDTRLVEAVAVAAAERVTKALPVLVAPTYGCAHYRLEFPGSMSLPTGPFIAAIEALSESLLLGHGFRRLLLNGHGGNHSP
jgi:creatinine amidohydrolase/Fe(II)-dependent formamide hydrolase-like protein